MTPELSQTEEGKRVFDGTGDSVGVVAEVRDGTAYVDPDDDVDGELKSKLDWGPTGETTYPLRHDAVDEVTDEAIRLRREYQ